MAKARRILSAANPLMAFAMLTAVTGHAILPGSAAAQQTSGRQAAEQARLFPDTAAVAPTTPANLLTYADIVDLAQAAEMVLRVEVRDQRRVEAERAPGLAPGQARLYLQARTQALLSGAGPAAEQYAFLTDVPLDARGRPPRLKRGVYLLFARRVPGRPGELQLVGPGAMQPVDPVFEGRLRVVLTQLVQGDRPPLITGVRQVISVPGNLAGESETQIFLATTGGQPVSLSVVRRPGMTPSWGVSWSEIVDLAARAPSPETLQWHALACHLPEALPDNVYLQRDRDAQARAREDYAVIRRELGNCARSL